MDNPKLVSKVWAPPRCKVFLFASLELGLKVVWIILWSNPFRIRILRMWINVLNIYVDVDNPNSIIGGCGVEYEIDEIWIWIIR